MASVTKDDSMDSLFEGMVLFDPCEMATADVQSPSVASPSTSLPRVSTDEPLDENLFSDLTLINPSHSTLAEEEKDEALPPHPPAAPSLSRLSSSNGRRRKKAAALRIGYGRDRDYASDDPLPHTHITSPSDDIRSESVPIPDKEEEEEEAKGQEENFPSSITAPKVDEQDMDAPHVNPIEFKYEQIRASVTDKLKLAREAVISVSALRKESIRRRRKTADKLNEASTLHRELEKELDEAVEAEDFETAERVSENLASAEKEKERLLILLRDAETHCDAVDSKMQEALDSLIQAEEECVNLLKRFSEEAAGNADSVLMNAEAMSSKDSAEWLSSVEAIEVSKFELEIQSQLVHEAKSILNESIDHRVEDDRRERDVFCQRKEVLTEELRKLLALVKEKEAEIAETDALIQKVENRIDGVVSGFKEVQASIDNKYDRLQSCLAELMVETEVLLKRKKDIDDNLSQEESRGEKIKNLSRISADEANIYEEAVGLRKRLAMFILQSMAYKGSLAKSEEMISEEVQILKQETSAAISSLQELSLKRSSIQQEVESCNQRHLFIDRRIPELEAEKKVAAATRNFKEAARLAAEAKALSIEKEEIQKKMDSAESELKALDEEISHTVDRMKLTEEQISSKEKELAMARFQRLILIARAARAERSAALELGDHEEAEALMEEADVAEVEARKLQPIYNFKEDEIENLPKLFISSELVSMLDGAQLAELAASANIAAS